LKGNQQFLLQKYVDQLRFLTQPSAICFWTLWDGQIFAILAWPDFNVSGGRAKAVALPKKVVPSYLQMDNLKFKGMYIKNSL